jgi:hypothetical protein
MSFSKSIAKSVTVSSGQQLSESVSTDGMLLAGIICPATLTGTALTFDFSLDNTTFVDVVETNGTAVSYTVTAGDVVRVDPSGWAFASSGFIKVDTGAAEGADREIVLIFRSA